MRARGGRGFRRRRKNRWATSISEIPPVLVTRPVHRRRNSLSFFYRRTFSVSELSTVFWIFSSISLRIWFYVAVSYRKTSKFVKKKREIFLWKSWVFRIFRLWEALFWQNFFEFLVFVGNVGKIPSSSSQSRRKNSKLYWYGLFLAGRSWRNFWCDFLL